MPTIALVLALSVALAAQPAAQPPPPAAPRDDSQPPPGTPADQALWKACYDVDNDLVIEQHTASRLQAGARAARLVERLRDPAARGKLSPGAAEALARRLSETWGASVDVMSSQWPVSKLRVCGYELLNFESVMLSDASPARQAQLPETRAAVASCVAKANRVLAAARRTNQELEAAIAEADRGLGPPAAKTATSSAGAPAKD